MFNCIYKNYKSISGKHLSAYVDYMKDKGYSASTIKTDLAAIRFWHDQIPDAKYVLPPNSEFILERRKFGGVDRTWSTGEFNRMITECHKANRDDYVGCITLARYAGLRLHDVLRIDTAIARKALKDGFITIKGKGGKIRKVPINDSIIVVLKKALQMTPQGYKLFVQKDKQTHIAKTELQNFIASKRKYICDEGSDRNLTFHGLRHTFAAEQYRKFIAKGYTETVAKLKVSKLLGHEREDVTRSFDDV